MVHRYFVVRTLRLSDVTMWILETVASLGVNPVSSLFSGNDLLMNVLGSILTTSSGSILGFCSNSLD